MRRKFEFWLVLALVMPWLAQAEVDMNAAQYPLVQYNGQVGVDVWRLSPELPSRSLSMPNNSTWRYRPESPWGTFDGRLTASTSLVFALKMRADQALGTHVDEFSGDWAYSPSFGFKAGVLSYSTSWCKTYNVDSPWVRENDPFCTSQSASEASGGAPGLQVYASTAFDDYRAQAMAGVYRPMLFNYNTKEFSNLVYASSHIDENNKMGSSVSILHTPSATEWRLGLLSTKQAARARVDYMQVDQITQTNGITFLGVSFYAAPRLNVRLQTLRHSTTSARWTPPGSVGPHYQQGLEAMRRSAVAELNYQYSTQNVLALALSRYSFDSTTIATNYPEIGYTRVAEFPYLLTSMSASWRHDWQKGMYTSVQWTVNKARASAFQTADTSTMNYRLAHGVGLRLGYQF